MKKLLFIITTLISLQGIAQVKEVTLQASGLTCSMCSKAIYKALEKMGIANHISSNIAESTYTLSFNGSESVDFDAIRKVVENAGFFVVKMEVKANFDNVKVQNDTHIILNGKALHFLSVKEQTLSGDQVFQIVDKKFVQDKVYKKYASTTKMECVKTGTMKACCNKDGKIGERIYHVTV